MTNKILNKFCPNSGKPIEQDCLTEYKGHRVGFCNPHCRDTFAADTQSESKAKIIFDALIRELD